MVEVKVLRTRDEIETLRDFWSSCSPARDADLDFFLFIVDLFAEALRPHVIAVYRNGVPEALIAGRLELSTIRIKAGYLTLPAPKMRILRFVHGGWLGEISDDAAKLLVSAVMDALARREADAAEFQFPDLRSSLVHWAKRLPASLCRDRNIRPQTRRVRDLLESARGSQPDFSQNERYQQRKRARRIEQDFSRSEVVHFRSVDDVEHLARDAEEIARKSYQRGIGAGFADTPVIRERLKFEAEKGWLRASILYLNGAPSAFWIGSLRNRVFLSDYLAFDSSCAQYSPGMYLIMLVIEGLRKDAGDDQRLVECIDFGIGDAIYKERLSNRHWDEGVVYIFSSSIKGIYTNLTRTAVGLLRSSATVAIGNTRIQHAIKRIWRQRAVSTR